MNLWRMNRSHAKLTQWGLTHVPIRANDTILDVGCGGGRTIARLAAIATGGKVYGVDFSDVSVAVSGKTNRASVDSGRVEVRQASVSHLPFPDAMFDVATAVETHYYWPDLVADLREVLRVLKPAGAFAIIAESYKGGKHDAMLQRLDTLQRRGIMDYALLTVAEHRAVLAEAGFTDVEVFEDYDKGWICATGRKPERR